MHLRLLYFRLFDQIG